jgi:hypothetical protein
LDWLPPLILLNDYKGNWNLYLDILYQYFINDFVKSSPNFESKRINIKRHPIEKNKEATFWHLISKGEEEADRLPDMRRCERIRWPRPMIDNQLDNAKIRIWKNKRRRGETRIVIAVEDFSYVVILAERRNYCVLWTAYCVEFKSMRKKLEKEYENYKNSQ